MYRPIDDPWKDPWFVLLVFRLTYGDGFRVLQVTINELSGRTVGQPQFVGGTCHFWKSSSSVCFWIQDVTRINSSKYVNAYKEVRILCKDFRGSSSYRLYSLQLFGKGKEIQF